MKKQQYILIGSGVVLFCLIYFFGNTIPPVKKPTASNAAQAPAQGQSSEKVDFQSILASSKKELTEAQLSYINKLETGIVRGDVKDQQIKVYQKLAAFWRDTAHSLLPYLYYTGEASKLENSEKSLTFAAHYFLEGVRRQQDPPLKSWMATEAKELFEQALKINPKNDSSKVGLGSCYLFGGISETPMQGLQMIREVAERDPDNVYAQFMLGLGGMQSGQFDKAAERLKKVVAKQPRNVEAVLMLAEACERTGQKEEAIKWYQASKAFFTDDASILKDINDRITELKK